MKSEAMSTFELRRVIMVALTMAGLSMIVSSAIHPPFGAPHARDGGFFAYLAEIFSRGLFPYRDFFSVHSFVHTVLGGFFFKIGGDGGLVVLGLGVFGLMTFSSVLLASTGLEARHLVSRLVPAGFVAWGISTGWPFLAAFTVSGGRPKFLAVALVGLGVFFLSRRKAGLSGMILAVSVWTWQPAVTLIAGSLLGVFVYSLMKRDGGEGIGSFVRDLMKIFLAGLLFSVGMALLLLAFSCLTPFIDQAILFPMRYPYRQQNPGVWLRMQQIIGLLPLPVLVCGGLSLVFWPLRRFLRKRQPSTGCSRSGLTRMACFGWIGVYGVYVWFDLDARGDMVPFLIPLGGLAGSMVGSLMKDTPGFLRWGVSIVAVLWLAGGDMLLPFHHSAWIYKPTDVFDQKNAEIIRDVANGRPVLIFADPLLQQALGEDPHHPYIFWEHGTLKDLREREEKGIATFLSRVLDQDFGAIVIGSRAASLEHFAKARLLRDYRLSDELLRRGRGVWVRRE